MDLNDLSNIEFYTELILRYASLGEVFAVLITFIEAFLPFLPLSVFVTVNVMAFGFFKGYIYSLLGTCLGSICVFRLIKKFAKREFVIRINQKTKLKNIFSWIHNKGFVPIFILYSFPFTPSFLVCGLAAVSDIPLEEYMIATFLGKAIMIFSMSFIGYNIDSFFEKPVRSIILILITILISYLGKRISSKYEKNRSNFDE